MTVPGPLSESLEKFHMEIGSALFTEIMVCLDGIFISDAHALAVLPNITHFALNEELPCAFVIVTCIATHATRDALFLLLSIGICAEFEYDVGMFTFCYD